MKGWTRYSMSFFLTLNQSKLEATERTEGFSSETFRALKITTLSSVSCTKHLLENVLTDKFSSDDIENFSSNLRQIGGENNATDCRSCLHAIE